MFDLPDAARAWLAPLVPWLTPLAVVSALLFVASLVALPWAAAALPADWLIAHASPADRRRTHPLRWLLRNAVAAVLALAGLLMLFLPGQGLLTLVAALIVSDLPFRDALLRRLLGQRAVLAAIDALRRRRGVGPMQRPPRG